MTNQRFREIRFPLGRTSKLKLRKFLKDKCNLKSNSTETVLNNILGERYTNQKFIDEYNADIESKRNERKNIKNLKSKTILMPVVI